MLFNFSWDSSDIYKPILKLFDPKKYDKLNFDPNTNGPKNYDDIKCFFQNGITKDFMDKILIQESAEIEVFTALHKMVAKKTGNGKSKSCLATSVLSNYLLSKENIESEFDSALKRYLLPTISILQSTKESVTTFIVREVAQKFKSEKQERIMKKIVMYEALEYQDLKDFFGTAFNKEGFAQKSKKFVFDEIQTELVRNIILVA
jgi:hypothetical protein